MSAKRISSKRTSSKRTSSKRPTGGAIETTGYWTVGKALFDKVEPDFFKLHYQKDGSMRNVPTWLKEHFILYFDDPDSVKELSDKMSELQPYEKKMHMNTWNKLGSFSKKVNEALNELETQYRDDPEKRRAIERFKGYHPNAPDIFTYMRNNRLPHGDALRAAVASVR